MPSDPDPFGEVLSDVADEQAAYGRQVGIVEERVPFAAETLPDARIAVRTNDELLREVAGVILNRAGHVSIIDERGAGKTHFRDLVYRSLNSSDRADEYRVARIREVESITTRRFYARLLEELGRFDDIDVPEELPHATDEVRGLVEDVAGDLEARDLTVLVQVDQLEDAARRKRTFEQLLAGLQSVGDLGEGRPVFLLFLFGTPAAGERIDDLRETLASRLVSKDRALERFGYSETAELVARWLAWARGEEFHDGYGEDPYAPSALEAIVERSDTTPRSVRQECWHAFRAGAAQFADTGEVRITRKTIEEYA